MIRAVYRDGTIQPLDALPADWNNNQQLEVRAVLASNVSADTDDWINERGAYANYTGEMPEHIREELERRLAELHALGPMEYEPGEEEDIKHFWHEMDEAGREEMKRMMGLKP